MKFIGHIAILLFLIMPIAFHLEPSFAQVQSAPFEWDGVSKVTAIGDVHGDFNSLVDILVAERLITRDYRWIGANRHLVMMGDLMAGGQGSKEVIELIISLETQAKKAGGRVHSLLGNHDLMVASGDFENMTKKERAAFVDERSPKNKDVSAKLSEMFLGDGRYANWMASRPIALRINDQIYVHAGLDERVSGISIEQINSLATDWILFFQGRGPRPNPKTGWIVGFINGKFRRGEGLAFSRDFKMTRQVVRTENKIRKGAMKRKELHELLAEFRVSRMVIGHVPTPGAKIKLQHPYYKNLVVSVDTKISDLRAGRLSALQVERGEMQKRYYERSLEKASQVNSCRSVLMD